MSADIGPPLHLPAAILAEPTYRCACFIDIVGSAEKKHTEPEASWALQTHMLYAIVEHAVSTGLNNAWVKYLGDGFLVVSDDEPDRMINVAVAVQESLAEARSGHRSAGVARMNLTVSIGITSGHVYEFQRADGGADYLGLSLDKAARLCSAASPNAVFVDRRTVQDASMRKVHSKVGGALRFDSDEYSGDVQLAPLKGFPDPVAYHEIRWDRELFGARSEVVTEVVDRLHNSEPVRTPIAPTVTPKAAGTGGIDRRIGKVKLWNADKRFGFVSDESDGEDFFFAPNLLVYPEDASDIEKDTVLAFVPVAAAADGKSRRAGACLIVGNDAEGTVVSRPQGKSHGWIRVADDHRNVQLVYVDLSAHVDIGRDTKVSFVTRVSNGRACADEIAAIV